MNKILLIISFMAIQTFSSAQADHKIYDPSINTQAQLKSAIELAKLESKHVLVQIGGNWCPWCIKFHKFVHDNNEIKTIIENDYVYILLNIDKTHPQKEMMKELNFPQRFGFPVFVILDNNGYQLHTQNSVYLEQKDSYNLKTVKNFLNNWNFKALSESSYE